MNGVLVAVFAALLITGSEIPLLASPQTIEGVISDTMCGKQHMLPGKTDAQCIKECIGGKTKYALVVGNKVYALSGPASEFEKYGGKKVRVGGKVGTDTIVVNSVGEASHR